MSLFRRGNCGIPLIFRCLNMTITELAEITKLIEDNGGKVGNDDTCIIKFMPRPMYERDVYPYCFVYDAAFITECVRKSTIVDLLPFRLGRKMSAENCVINCFLYGHCAHESCDENEVAIEENMSLEFFTADFHSPIVQSQSVVPHYCAQRFSPSFASGDDSPSHDIPTDVSDEKRPCNVEYEAVVERKLQKFLRHLKESPQQRRSPRTLPTTSMRCSGTASSTSEIEFLIAKRENSVEEESQWIGESVKSSENLETHRINVTAERRRAKRLDESESLPRSNIEAMVADGRPYSSGTTVLALSSKSPKILETSKFMVTPSSRESKKPRGKTLTELTVEREVHRSMSPRERTQGSKSTEITAKRKSGGSHRSPELIVESDEYKSESPRSASKSRGISSSLPGRTKNISLIEKTVVGTELSRENESSVKGTPKNVASDDEWNLPGISGAGKRMRTVDRSFIDSDGSEDNRSTEVRVDISPNYNQKKKSHFYESDESTAEKRDSNPGKSNSTDYVSGTDSTSVEIICVEATTQKISRKKSGRRTNESNGKERESKCSSGESDASYRKHKSRESSKKSKRKKKSSELHSGTIDVEDIDDRVTISDEDEEEEEETKRKKDANKENQQRNSSRKRRVTSNSKSDCETVATSNGVGKKKKKISGGWSDKRNVNETKKHIDLSYESGDEGNEETHSEDPTRCMSNLSVELGAMEKRKKNSALNYGRIWRSELKSVLPSEHRNIGKSFTKEDQRSMISFLLGFKNFDHIFPKGLKIWQQMIQRGILRNRTPQSLQNHFVKYLLPRIQDFFYLMTPEEQKLFKDLQMSSRK